MTIAVVDRAEAENRHFLVVQHAGRNQSVVFNVALQLQVCRSNGRLLWCSTASGMSERNQSVVFNVALQLQVCRSNGRLQCCSTASGMSERNQSVVFNVALQLQVCRSATNRSSSILLYSFRYVGVQPIRRLYVALQLQVCRSATNPSSLCCSTASGMSECNQSDVSMLLYSFRYVGVQPIRRLQCCSIASGKSECNQSVVFYVALQLQLCRSETNLSSSVWSVRFNPQLG
jgi:hypothetical protein